MGRAVVRTLSGMSMAAAERAAQHPDLAAAREAARSAYLDRFAEREPEPRVWVAVTTAGTVLREGAREFCEELAEYMNSGGGEQLLTVRGESAAEADARRRRKLQEQR